MRITNRNCIPIGELVVPANSGEKVDSAVSYRLLGVSLGGRGAFYRETKMGSETSAATLYKVANGDLVYSRLFAWQGAFSLINKELDGCYVSNEFPVFKVKSDKVHPQYLLWWLCQSDTLRKVESDCTGSTPLTRNRYKEQFFFRLSLPLPPLDVQHEIVARTQSMINQIEKAKQLSADISSDFDRLMIALAQQHSMFDKPRHPMQSIAPLVRRPVSVDVKEVYPELGVRSFGKGTFHKPPLSGADVGTKKLFWIHPDDLVFQIVFAWEGAVAIAKPEDVNRCGSHRFLTCVCNPDQVLPDWLLFYFLTPLGLAQLGEASPGGAGRNRTLGIDKLARMVVPLPPLEQQGKIATIMEAKRKYLELHTFDKDAEALRRSMLAKVFRSEL